MLQVSSGVSQFKVIAKFICLVFPVYLSEVCNVVARVLIVAVRRRVVLVKVIDLMVVSSNSCDGGWTVMRCGLDL